MDWREFRAIKFFAKSSAEGLSLNEFNLFVGKDHIQYLFDLPGGLPLSTEWREIEIPFDSFRLPSWASGADRTLGSRAAHVTAFGFDVKSQMFDLQASVWIDFVRLVRRDGSVIQLSDGDAEDFNFGSHGLKWFSSTRVY